MIYIEKKEFLLYHRNWNKFSNYLLTRPADKACDENHPSEILREDEMFYIEWIQRTEIFSIIVGQYWRIFFLSSFPLHGV